MGKSVYLLLDVKPEFGDSEEKESILGIYTTIELAIIEKEKIVTQQVKAWADLKLDPVNEFDAQRNFLRVGSFCLRITEVELDKINE